MPPQSPDRIPRRRGPKARVQLRMSIPLRDRLLREARDAGVSLNAYIETACFIYLEFLQDQPRPTRPEPDSPADGG